MPNWIPRNLTLEIMEAVEAEDGFTRVFYITSEGGEGKTILLRQVGMALGSEDGMVPSSRWSGILDLYHSDVNTNSGLEAHLSRALETEEKEFEPYREQRDTFLIRRAAGLVGPELEEERARVAEVFAACVNAVTEKRRVVIALDTTERIQYEVDAVQERCHLEAETTTVRAWLLVQLLLWKNCVLLLVGRPEADPYLGQALEDTLGEHAQVRYAPRTLGGFSEDEARAYFEEREKEVSEVGQIDPDFRHLLWEVTGGSPIRLELAVEVIQRGLGFDKFQEKVEQGPLEVAREEIDRLLVQSVMGDPDDALGRVLRYLTVARRGLDRQLLHHLAGEWGLEECQRYLGAVAERGFVKRRPNDDRLFLHDEMYLLCDRYLLQADEVQRLSQRIVAWYEERIRAATETDTWQDLQVDSLLYRLRANPRQGYHWYARQAEFAIRSAQAGLDMQLRSEVLAFLRSKNPIDRRLVGDTPGLMEEFNCDSAARWVKRLMVRGKNKQAVQVGGEACPAFCPDAPEFALARADLAVYRAQAMIYSGRAAGAVELLREVIAGLEGDRRPEDLASQDPETYEGWRRKMVLGRAHNNMGYVYWNYLNRYAAALREFHLALPYFQAPELAEERANTQDNRGRVYALFRHPTRAATLVDEGLMLRGELGREYRVGLSLNSRAIVYLEFNEPHQALQLSERALGIFEGLGAQRGIGLALITLGRSLRQMGGLWVERVYPHESCDRYFTRGAEALQRAVQVFEERVDEPLKLVEALNELGCIYRDRAWLLQEEPSSPLVGRGVAVEARRCLEGCVKLADEKGFLVQYIDACEDLANAWFLQGHYDNARFWLGRAEERVSEEYKFREGAQPPEIPDEEERVEPFWLQMGKIELLRGNIVWDEHTDSGKPATREVLEKTAEHYLLASVYFERYAARAVGLRSTFRQMYVRFKYAESEDMTHLRRVALKAIASKYGIDMSRLGNFFEDTLGLAVER